MKSQAALSMSGVEMAEKIRHGELSSRTVVDLHIEAIERVNPTINAVVAKRYTEARAEADRADIAVRDGHDDLGPFHGVPCTIKEALALEGMPNTSGLAARLPGIAEQDATVVSRLRAAGAIPLGVTNTSELCMWMESKNPVYGRTCNPYDHRRTAGGSSGGEGAIVGSGASPIGLGSDIGGSIRMPAFFCGAFGHKATGDLVPSTGHYPLAENEALRLLSAGPITRRAADLFPLLKIIAGPDEEDPSCCARELGDPSTVQIEDLDVISISDNGRTPVSASLRAAQKRCADYFRERGARVREVRIKKLRRSFDIWAAIMTNAGGTSFRDLLGQGTPIKLLREMRNWVTRRSAHTLPALALAALESLPPWQGEAARALIQQGQELQGELEEQIGDGVMLYPSYSSIAPRHSVPLLHPFHFVYTGIINTVELPATQVPLGLDKKGVPLGVQVVATRGNDHRTIAVACELERAFGGWTPPPLS